MNEHTLRVLEYDKVKSIVAAYAASEAGKAMISGLHPVSDAAKVSTLLKEAREFTEILQSGEKPPLNGIVDIRHVVEKLRASGGMLVAGELLDTATTLGAGRRVKTFFQKIEAKGTNAVPGAPLLCAKAAGIHPLKQLEDAVFAAIDEKAEIKDSASPALRKVRKQVARMREDILARMNGILQDTGYQKVIQEPVITIRDDRYVLPLKPNFRQNLQGVVHGQSGSRATLFVEPLDVLEQNNRLAELRMEEREEVERILRELTSLLSKQAETIEETIRILSEIDAVYARAQFGLDYEAVVPLVSTEKSIRLRGARHPLLVGKSRAAKNSVIPNDIMVEGEHRAMILSGPNAGGKTVILKTAGLLCLMAQSGLPITASEGSEIPCFSAVFADIGDEQSLEQDLSTFSSHVSRIAEILREADRDSLVLLDELGSGTEPGEGAGLGAAVLESLIERGCVTVVTTHHNALKLFGSHTSGATNAAMEFDPQTLKPTYRLIPGRPGRSYGLDMASRMGLPAAVIQKARSRISDEDVNLDRLLRQMEEDSRQLRDERESLERELTAARQDRKEADEALRSTRDEAREIKAKARTEAREILTALRRKMRELSHVSAVDAAEAKRTGAEVEALSRKLATEVLAEQATARVSPRDLKAGDTVRIEKLNKTGRVLASHRDKLEIEVGGKKITLSAAEVIPVESQAVPQSAARTPGWSAELHEEESAADRLNIIGLRVPEGLAEVDRFIDRAGLHHLTVVTIIHGLGTGALKNAVMDFLKNHPLVASIRQGGPAEGGAGVTVAELKK